MLLLSTNVRSQINIQVSNNLDRTPERLVKDVFLGNGVRINSVRQIGSSLSIGQFSGAVSDINLDNGIVLSTGSVKNIDRANDNPSTGDTPEGTVQSDPDLQALTPYPIKEVTGLEIEFVSQSPELEFRYVFASEEYPEFNCSKFNDIFAFFISGPNPAGGVYDKLNIALVPDPSDPSGNTFTDFPVWTNSVNNGMPGTDLSVSDVCDNDEESLDFSQYYNDNTGSLTFTFDGFLDVFKAKATVVPCQVYTIKLIIGDNNDFDFDSAVFMEANSLASRNYEYYINTNLNGTLTESCNRGSIGIKFDNPVTERTEIPLNVLNNLPTDIDINADVRFSSNSFVLNPGDSTSEINIEVIEDFTIEDVEYLRIVEDVNGCSVDTFSVPIYDNPLETYFGQLDGSLICINEPLVSVDFPRDEQEYFEFNSVFGAIEFGNSTVDPIEVAISVSTSNLSEWNDGLLNSICIDGFTHTDASEVSMIIVSPSGFSLRIVDFGDLTGSFFSETICFDQVEIDRLLKTVSLRNEDINGEWRLLLIDGTINSMKGSIDRWSIGFNNPDFLSYTIVDDEGNVIDPTDPVIEDMRLFIEAQNANGCEFIDTVDITAIPDITAPTSLTCTEIDRDQLEFSWSHSEESMSFEVNYGIEWIEVGNNFSYRVSDLGPSQTVFFEVRAIATGCSSAEAELTCGTSPCIEPELIIRSRANSDNACNPNGFIEIRSSNTKGPYKYWINDEVNDSFRFENLGEGSYIIRIEDGYGCFNESTISLSGVGAMKVDINKFDAFCGQQGFIDMFVSGGTPPYRYMWSTGSNERDVNGLDAGLYTVNVSDDSGCTIIDSVEILASSTLEILDIVVTDVDCATMSDGRVDYSVSGGTIPYQYVIKNSRGQEYTSNVGLPAESYIIEVSDFNGCVNIKSFDILPADELSISFTSQPTSCSFASDGSAEVFVTGGVEPYTYLWSNGDTSRQNAGLSSGTQSIIVVDANGCEASNSVTISASEEPILDFSQSNVSCFEGADGFISVDVTNMSFSVLWDNGAQAPNLSRLVAGNYCVSIVTEFGCVIDTCFQIVEPRSIRSNVSTSDNICFGVNDGSIVLNVSEGESPYQISYEGNTTESTGLLVLNDLNFGDYNFEIVDANGCTSLAEATIAPASEVLISLETKDVSCAFGSDGRIQTTVIGANEITQYVWSGPDNFTSNNTALSNIEAGVYSLTILDINGCSFTQAITVNQPTEAITAEYTQTDVTCYDAKDGFIQVNASGGVGALSYSLNSESGFSGFSGFSSNHDFFNLDTGIYTIYVRDESDCSVELSNIRIDQPIEFRISLDFDTLVYEFQDIELKVDVQDPQGGYDLFWSSDPADLLPCSNCDSVTIFEIERSVILAVEAIDDAGCSAYTEQKVFVRRGNHIAVPTAFTPNGDLNNDILHIYGTSNAIVKEFSIYDKTGVKLFSDQNISVNLEDRGWDGRYKGIEMITGSYIWTALAEFPDEKSLKFSGSVQLIR